MAHQLERELCWCIHQLQIGLTNKNPDTRQAEEAVRLLKVLKNPKAPLVKKRQVMRMTFGDYRKKMVAEEKQNAAEAAKMSLSAADQSVCKQSTFYKVACKKNIPIVPADEWLTGAYTSHSIDKPPVNRLNDVTMDESSIIVAVGVTKADTTRNHSNCDATDDQTTLQKDSKPNSNGGSKHNDPTSTPVADNSRLENIPKDFEALNSRVNEQKLQSDTTDVFKFERSDNVFRFSFSDS